LRTLGPHRALTTLTGVLGPGLRQGDVGETVCPTASRPSLRESPRGDSLDCFRNDGAWATAPLFQIAFQIADMPWHSRGAFRPSFPSSLHPLSVKRAQGRPGAGWHPWPVVPKKRARNAQRENHRAAENTRPSLRSGLTAYARSPRRRILVCLRRPADWLQLARLSLPHLRGRLDRSNDGQDHTVLPYAISAVRTTRLASAHGARLNPLPRPALDIRADAGSRPPQPGPRS
jgi:hypothetical protein